MVIFFDENELVKATKQKKRVIIGYIVACVLFALLAVFFFVWYSTIPHGSSEMTTVKLIHYPLVFLFAVFSYIYLDIIFGRVNKYAKFMYNLKTGHTETSEAELIRYEENVEPKDGVDCKKMIFSQWYEKRHDFFERQVFVPAEMEFPDIPVGKKVRFVTQGNTLKEYEIIGDSDSAGTCGKKEEKTTAYKAVNETKENGQTEKPEENKEKQ